MKIDGKSIAGVVKENLKKQVIRLRRKNIIPQLAVILIGHNPSSIVYIKQKMKTGKEIGVIVKNYELRIKNGKKKLTNLVNRLNNDPAVHGIIIQRPLPIEIEKKELDGLVKLTKDVDGFHPHSPFTPPVAAAVFKILTWVKNDKKIKEALFSWLKKQRILIIGRGETAGKPIAAAFIKSGIKFELAHSQTKNLKKLSLNSDIIISCVGKPHIVRHNLVNPNTLLLGVGLHPENDRLYPDYNQKEIEEKVAYYTPVPGGVGPVNVACLFENLIFSCQKFL